MKITLRLGKSLLIALLTAMAFSCSVRAQSDNFDDGDDTANPTWTHYDPIADVSGVPGGSWTFPGSNTYRLQAFADAVGVGEVVAAGDGLALALGEGLAVAVGGFSREGVGTGQIFTKV